MPAPARAAILAGGLATRMGGRNKALLEVDGRAILDRQLEVLRPQFPSGALAAVLAAGASAADAAPFAARGLEVLRDTDGGRGPLAGLTAALEWSGETLLFALACDMPCVDPRVVDMIVTRAHAACADIALPVDGGRHQPLFACYSPRCLALFLREMAANRLKLSALPGAARAAGLVVHEIDAEEIRTIDPDLRSFVNLNRLSDLASR
ncbi:MAG TPA: molybdenum cofactor guanylyltransferase [Kofleriaceae bacterium]|nr:molybdenum cofactor guanylyltransferase [Kofleriaceae bacterium]